MFNERGSGLLGFSWLLHFMFEKKRWLGFRSTKSQDIADKDLQEIFMVPPLDGVSWVIKAVQKKILLTRKR